MISNQSTQSSKSNANYSSPLLTVEESFFIELLQKREKSTINIKFTTQSAQVGNLEPFTNYYTETEILRILESLVSKKIIVKQEKGVVLLCSKCGGHVNMPVLVCPRCGSTKVGRKEDINHSECKYWGPREEFIDGVLLHCPRCDELLDEKAAEGTSGYFSVSDPYFECQDCGTAVSKSNITMVCIKCSNKYTFVQASYLNSVSYVLASVIPEKIHKLPPKTIQEKIEDGTKSQSLEESKTISKSVSPPSIIEEKQEAEPEKIEEESQYRLLEESKAISKSEPRSPGIEERQEADQKQLETIEQEEPDIEERSASLVEQKEAEPVVEQKEMPAESKIEKINSELIDEPIKESIKKPVDEPIKEPVEAMITEPEPDVILEPVETSEPAIEEKPKQEILQTPFRLVTDLFKKKPRKKSTRKQKNRPEPEPEPEFDDETFDFEDEPVFEEPQPVKTTVEPEAYQILMIVENVTVSEFIIESLEGVNKPINVIHIDDGSMALKELRHKYDALILDLDLKTVNSKFLLSEMEKWSIMTPIIAVSDNVQRLDKYILNVETVLKKKQGEINKIRKILQKLL